MLNKKVADLLNLRYVDVPPWERGLMRTPLLVTKWLMLSTFPSAVITCFLLLLVRKWSILDHTMLLWSICEIACYTYWKKRMEKPYTRKSFTIALNQRVPFAKHILSHTDNIKEIFSRWMLVRPPGALSIEYFKPFIRDMFFEKDISDMSPNELVIAEDIYDLFNEHIKQTPEPTKSLAKVHFMSPANDTFPYYPKSLVFSLIIFTTNNLAHSAMCTFGFRRHETRGLAYWFLSGDSDEPPIMYIHGLGVGYILYLTKIYSIMKAHPGRAIILLEFPHVCMQPSDVILDHDQTLQELDVMFLRHNLEKVSLVSHSYGTIVANWIIRQRPQYVAKSVLVVPVCFMMWDPTMANTIFYAAPFCMSHEGFRFSLAADPLISLALTKKMYWYESVLYPEYITMPTTIFLAQDDFMVDSYAIQRYLEKLLPSHSRLVLLDTFHGGSLLHHENHDPIIRSM
ncbi:hypothetical protein DSO57_1003057 [Entomophthora muscae]|uniref:Uncharacterized protein n=1 Tax=Entomophthora muscae TaxID=34485 RepID=A0ACC2TJC3_9FUNG|nr:hypothetical protein DSO57_1003057 [Entomophthora muscae]